MTDVFCIAETKIEIASHYGEVQQLCRDYRSDGEPALRVAVTPEDLA